MAPPIPEVRVPAGGVMPRKPGSLGTAGYFGGPGLFRMSRLPLGWNRRVHAQRSARAWTRAAGLRPGPAGRRERSAKRAALNPYRNFSQDTA
jgi:hypothetical protein